MASSTPAARGPAADDADQRGRPKYQQIHARIAEAIRTGELSPGERLPLEEELISRYGASRNTIIRALVSLRDEGLLERVQGVGTFVADTAGRRQTFGFIADGRFTIENKDTVFAQLEVRLAQRLRDRQADLVLQARHLDGDTAAHRQQAVDRLVRQGVAGVFYLPMEGPDAAEIDRRILARLDEAGVPVVLLDADIAHPEVRGRHDVVGLDNFTAGYLLAKHLYDRGARSMLFLAHSRSPTTVGARIRGARDFLDHVGGHDPRFQVVTAASTAVPDVQAVLPGELPDAILAKDDGMAAALMRVLYKMDVRVPEQVLVAGFDDSPIASELTVPLTSVRQPVAELADAALWLLETRRQQPGRPARRIVIGGELTIRDSA